MTTFQEVLTDSSTKVWTRLDVIDANGTSLETGLDVVDGEVTVDKGRSCRRECTVTVVDPTGDLVPKDVADLFHPNSGNQIRLLRGLYDRNGVDFLYYPLGTFAFNRPQVRDMPTALTVSIDGQDRAKLVQEGRLTDTVVIASGTNYSTAIQTLVQSAYPLALPSFAGTSRTAPKLVFEPQADPWEEASKMATALGMELFFDPWGFLTLRAEPVPTPSSAAVATYAEGTTAMLTGLTKDLDAEASYNWVVVSGEHSENTAPVRAEAYDNNPSSPSYVEVSGGYVVAGRKKPKFYSSPFITSTAQAQEAADAILRRSMGVAENVSLEATVNPALDVGDVIRVVRERSKVDALYVVDRLTIPMRWDAPMQVATRRVA